MTPLRIVVQSDTLHRWLRFNLVGALGVGVQLAAVVVFNHAFGLGDLTATALAVEVSLLHNFVWHERFTWAVRPVGLGVATSGTGPGPTLGRLLAFNLTNGVISLAGGVVFVGLLMGPARLPLLAANLAAIACCGVLNFVVSDRVVFRPRPRARVS